MLFIVHVILPKSWLPNKKWLEYDTVGSIESTLKMHMSLYNISAYHFHIQHMYISSRNSSTSMKNKTGFPSKAQRNSSCLRMVLQLCPNCFLQKIVSSPRHCVWQILGRHDAMTFALSSTQNAKKNMLSDFHFINDKYTLKVPGHRTNRDSFFASRSLSTCSGITTLNEVHFRIRLCLCLCSKPKWRVDQIEKE